MRRQRALLTAKFSFPQSPYLSYVREQNREIRLCPILLLPCMKLLLKLFQHSFRVPASSQLWVAKHATYTVTHHLLSLVCPMSLQSYLSKGFAARQYLPGPGRWSGGVYEDPEGHAAVARQGLIAKDFFASSVGGEREGPAPLLSIEVPCRKLLGGGGMNESEGGRIAGGQVRGGGDGHFRA